MPSAPQMFDSRTKIPETNYQKLIPSFSIPLIKYSKVKIGANNGSPQGSMESIPTCDINIDENHCKVHEINDQYTR